MRASETERAVYTARRVTMCEWGRPYAAGIVPLRSTTRNATRVARFTLVPSGAIMRWKYRLFHVRRVMRSIERGPQFRRFYVETAVSVPLAHAPPCVYIRHAFIPRTRPGNHTKKRITTLDQNFVEVALLRIAFGNLAAIVLERKTNANEKSEVAV